MVVVLWVVQVVLALLYLIAGFTKAVRPLDEVGKRMPWSRDVAPGLVRFIGAAELLGAIGLVLPEATGILPWLTWVAALGLVAVQVLAAGFHTSRRELGSLPMNALLLLLAAFVVYGRLALVSA